MADVESYNFTYAEVVEALVKRQGLHKGLWALRVEFGLGAANINQVEGSKDATPAAIIPLVKLGIQVGKELNNLTVDAAKVNPRPASAKAAKRKTPKKQ
jgi:hypothetical protein